jgi:hypothetical protein
MSEFPQCPYCGAILWEGPVKHTKEGIKLICDTCARSYVYIPGYGSFALTELDTDEHSELPISAEILEDEEFQDSKNANIGKACITLCCILSSVPFVLIMAIMVLFSLF